MRPTFPPALPTFLAAAVLTVLIVGAFPAAAQNTAAPVSEAEKTVLVLGDTQAPLFWEKLILPQHRNIAARRKILELILGEPDPAAVLHLGDAIAVSSEEDDWKPIDEFLAALRARRIPAFGVLGNHEYMTSSARGAAAFRKRYPEFPRSWYAFKIPPLAFIVLNSNFGELTGPDRAEQRKFYEEQLAVLENEAAVKGIVVCTHHPPQTNSRIVNPSREVEADFVPLFLRSPKTILFLSGHSHAAEHFVRDDKHFLVTGGGGGLLHPLRLGSDAHPKDHFPLQTERRWFHYLRLQAGGSGWTATYRMLRQDLKNWLDIPAVSDSWK